MLEILDMSKHYGDVHAVNNLTLTIPPGEIFTMLGANGAGKTTTLMVALGFTEPTNGTVKICGIDVTRDPLKAKKHVAYVSENVMLYGNFTARQNLEFFTKLGGRKNVTKDEYEYVMDRVGLQRDAFERRLKGFSKGMRQKLGIAIAIMKNAEVILLDEPTSGLDPNDIFRAKQVADRIGIMVSGNLVKIFTRDELKQADLEAVYMEFVSQPAEQAA